MNARRLLLLIGQSPFDPTSGAAQATRQMAELLAGAGWTVEALATSGCEGDTALTVEELLAAHGGTVERAQHLAGARVLCAQARGVRHRIVLTAPARRHHWEQDVGACYAASLDEVLARFDPRCVLTYGDDAGDRIRRQRLRAHGARVVFVLHNLAYLRARPAACDAFVCPSRFLAGRYEAAWGEAPRVLPTPLMPAPGAGGEREPVFVTFVNPEPAKGVALIARLAERLGRERPDIPLLVVEGRARAAQLLAAGDTAGFDLRRWPNLMFSPALPDASALWARTRVVLMPSQVEEAAGRCALEAMAQGAVALVSARGALPETVGDAGIVLPPDDPDAWFAALLPLCDDEALYAARSEQSCRQARAHAPQALQSRYVETIEAILARP